MECLNQRSSEPTHDVCLFTTESCENTLDQKTMAGNIEELLKKGDIYHTLRHPFPRTAYIRRHSSYVLWDDTIWNLPLPLRPPTDEQRRDISNWIFELRGEKILQRKDQSSEQERVWESLQLSYFFLKEGMPWETATREADQVLPSEQDQPQPGSRGLWWERERLYLGEMARE